MKGRTHIIVGAATGVAISYYTDISIYEAVSLVAIGSIITDLDEDHSKINSLLFKKVPVIMRAGIKVIVALLLGYLSYNKLVDLEYRYHLYYFAGLLAISAIASIFSKITFSNHRTVLHDPIIGNLIMVTPLFFILDPTSALLITIGIEEHYLLDSMTPYGLPLYLFGKRLRLLKGGIS